MTAFIEPLNAAAAVWSERMWAVVWQSAVLTAVVALLAGLLLRRVPPSIRYWVWQVLALKLLLMPFWAVAMPMPRLDDTSRIETVFSNAQEVPADTRNPLVAPNGDESFPVNHVEAWTMPPAGGAARRHHVTWQSGLFLAWCTLVAVQVARLLWQRRRLGRLLREASSADGTLTTLIAELARPIGLVKAPRVVLTTADCSPFACGARDAVVVIPARLVPELSPIELRHVLLHELAHVRRRDLVWGWISELARIVYFFHPVVHWIAYRARLERELACDQLAMANSGRDAGEYAATLVRVISHSSEPTVFKTAAASAGLDGDGS